MGDYSAILFARPSFAEGMGRLLDFGNTLSEYNRSFTGELADMAALRADALALGADFGNALAESQRVKQIAKQKQ